MRKSAEALESDLKDPGTFGQSVSVSAMVLRFSPDAYVWRVMGSIASLHARTYVKVWLRNPEYQHM